MLTRIVKMTFKKENIPSFEQIFQASRPVITAFPGCEGVTLYRDLDRPEIFVTYSIWDTDAALQDYRRSPFFREVWGQTKALFAAPAEAWSLEEQTGEATNP